MERLFISLVMVVKNEEAVIARLFDSVQGGHKFWDELVVVDTGSTDRTRDIARQYGARLVEQPWPNDFAKARNMAAQAASPEARVVVNLDADEKLGAGGDRLRARIEDAYARGKRLMSLEYHWAHDAEGRPTVIFPRQVIFDPRLYTWSGRVHECLVGPLTPERMEHFQDVVLEHWPRAYWSEAKSKRDLELLKLEVLDHPARPRGWYYLGREYTYHKRWEDAIRALESYLRIATWPPERGSARALLGQSHAALGNERDAVAQFMAGILETPDRREPYLALASYYFDRKNWQQVVIWCQAALAIPSTARPTDFTCPASYYSWLPHDHLSVALYYLGRKDEGREHWRQAHAQNPADERIRNNGRWFE